MVLTRPLVLVAFSGALLSLVPSSTVVQSQNAPVSGPAGWKWALDAPARLLNGGKFESADSLFEFVHMALGWHITMGPGAALFDSRERAEGRFAVQGELILFPNASANEYGLFVGGRDLEGQAKQWLAFVVRAEPDSVRFLVNDERIAAFARGAIDVDGAFGFRIGQGVNLHITNLDVTRRLAPFPARR